MDLLRDPEGMGLEQYFYDACSGAGFQPDVVQNATDVPTVISPVSAGFGVALLPASAKAVSVENVVYVDILTGCGRANSPGLPPDYSLRSAKSFWLRSITPDVLLPAGAARAAGRSPDPGCFSGASTC